MTICKDAKASLRDVVISMQLRIMSIRFFLPMFTLNNQNRFIILFIT